MESKKLKKKEKQINRQVGENKTRNQSRKLQRYKQGAEAYFLPLATINFGEGSMGC
jgi:hypothetical protein